jgi:transcriptional regulator with XRE-family HTH domain
MKNDKPSNKQDKVRAHIARKVLELRKARRWTQTELSEQLHVSQGRLSELERGDGSFTAEQLITLIKLFNVPLGEFSPEPPEPPSELQNALARLGATHLQESATVVPSERLTTVGDVVRETLTTAESPRLVTALAPVLLQNVDDVPFKRLYLQFLDMGLERRFGWLVDNTIAAIQQDVTNVTVAAVRRRYRRAHVLLDSFLAFVADQPGRAATAPDILDRNIRTKQTLEEVSAAGSSISRRWGIFTSLQPEDFATALRSARDAHR